MRSDFYFTNNKYLQTLWTKYIQKLTTSVYQNSKKVKKAQNVTEDFGYHRGNWTKLLKIFLVFFHGIFIKIDCININYYSTFGQQKLNDYSMSLLFSKNTKFTKTIFFNFRSTKVRLLNVTTFSKNTKILFDFLTWNLPKNQILFSCLCWANLKNHLS